MCDRFVAGGDDPESTERRNGAFKLIPKIVKGSWLVKQSVGETPVLLGRKLTTKYFRWGASKSPQRRRCNLMALDCLLTLPELQSCKACSRVLGGCVQLHLAWPRPALEQARVIMPTSCTSCAVCSGKKVRHLRRGPNYMEVDIDVASSSVARHVVGLVSGASKSVVVDMGILLQVGPTPHSLPDCGCMHRALRSMS